MPKKIVDVQKVLSQTTLEGDFVKIEEVLNKDIEITGFKILPSSMFDNEYVLFELTLNKQKKMFSISSSVILSQIKRVEEQYGNTEISMRCKIIKMTSKSSGREYYTLENL